MTIDEAIKLLDIAKDGFPVYDAEKYCVAMGLGIEAMKREKANREDPDYVRVGQLPGETEEKKED